ncbi:hypothetical protein ACIOJE_30475 [Kitasatospora sp. NPDC087861]|uniref:hypothetical protein n=1 Tax=Kitasatospora sp. NPDC087861 TaxID=3364070 RepID=UPI0037FA0D7F
MDVLTSVLQRRPVLADRAERPVGHLAADRRSFDLALLALAGNTRPVEAVADLHNHADRHSPARLAQPAEPPTSAMDRLELVELMLAGDLQGRGGRRGSAAQACAPVDK